MATGKTVSDGRRLSNDDLGALARKFREIARRIEEGTINFDETLKGLQSIAEGKTVPQQIYIGKAHPREFRLPKVKDRKRSLGGTKRRLRHYLERLAWPERDPEHIIVELWEVENIPERGLNSGRVPIDAILDEREGAGSEMFGTFRGPAKLEERDIRVVNSTIQWLGTNVGMSFLRKFLGVSQIFIN